MTIDPAEQLGRPLSPHQVWPFKGHLGFRRSIESAGTVAAPLLAASSFTLLVLTLPTLPRGEGKPPSSAADAEPFSALPEIAAVLFLVAGLLLIGSVQATISMRYFSHTPSDLEEWYPQYFREAKDTKPAVQDLRQWSLDFWPPEQVDGKWFGGWTRFYLFSQLLKANRWAKIARNLYHTGILALLAGLTVAVIPPADAQSLERWILTGTAVAGLLGELIWIRYLDLDGKPPSPGRSRQFNSPPRGKSDSPSSTQ